ncbi:MAG: hypothetical protein IPM56_08585 [Ignavibacteriales bacterium]|nr:MAG: hypothetical protein IPM56_08585 [Ignavibacteriales bacterium]
MKKGCFIKSIIILTILTAAVVYIIKYKFDDFILKPGKQLLAGALVDEWTEKIDFVKNSPEKDSLKNMVTGILSSVKKEDLVTDESLKSVMAYVSEIVKDSIVETSELNFIAEKIKAELQNERSTQN